MAILSTVCYIEKNGKYLMLHRNKNKKNDANDGKWIGVGGKFEKDESAVDCVIREVYEETNLKITKYKFRGIVTFVSDKYETEYMHIFTASEFEGNLIEDCLEGQLKWVDKNKLDELDQWEGDKYFHRKINENDEFFTLKLIYEGDNLVI